MNAEAGRELAREQRRALQRRKQLEKRLRKPWLIFRSRLRPEMFEEAAIAATGLDDFGDDYYRDGLETLLTSLRTEADLKLIGRLIMQRAIALALRQRLLLQELRVTNAEILSAPLLAPIIITGLPRTGTTLLHRLLAQDKAFHAPDLEELMLPIPPPSGISRFVTRTRLATEVAALRFMSGGLDTMHMSRIDQPEECMFALSQTFRSVLFWTLSPCYGYMDWYSRSARGKKYRDYRDILLLLQARMPGRRLLLKAPDHLGSLGDLLEAIPDAMIIVCHRHTPDAVTSFNSLIHALHSTVSSSPDPVKIGATNLSYFEAETWNYVKARKRCRDRIFEIDYDRLVADPVSIAADIYGRAGIALAPEMRNRFQSFVAANPKDKHGSHRYQPSDYGQTAGIIAKRLAHYTIEPPSLDR